MAVHAPVSERHEARGTISLPRAPGERAPGEKAHPRQARIGLIPLQLGLGG